MAEQNITETKLDYSLLPTPIESGEDIYTELPKVENISLTSPIEESYFGAADENISTLMNIYGDISDPVRKRYDLSNVLPEIPKSELLRNLDIRGLLKDDYTEADIAALLITHFKDKGFIPPNVSSKKFVQDFLTLGKNKGFEVSDIITHFTGIPEYTKSKLIGEGFLRGAGIATPSTIAGMKAFVATGGPANPALSIPASLAATVFTGIVSDNILNNFLFPEDSKLPKDLPFYEGGKTVGFMAPSSVAAKFVPTNKIDEIMAAGNQILNNIKSYNNAYRRAYEKAKGYGLKLGAGGLKLTKEARPRVEGTAIASAGVAGGTAEFFDPENMYLRLPAEIATYATNPVSFVSGYIPFISAAIRKMAQRFSEEGQTNAASDSITKIFKSIQDKGFDVNADKEQIANALLKEMPTILKDVNISAAEKEAFFALKEGKEPLYSLFAIQNKVLSEDKSGMGLTLRKQQKDSLDNLSKLLDLMISTGNPQLINAAARIKEDFFTEVLEKTIASRASNAVNTANKVISREVDGKSEIITQKTAADASAQIVENVKEAFNNARKVQTGLYNKIDQDVTLDASPLIQAYLSILKRRSPNYLLSKDNRILPDWLMSDISKFTNATGVPAGQRAGLNEQTLNELRIGVGPNRAPKVKLKDLLTLRTELLENIRSTYADPTKFGNSAILLKINEGLTKTLELNTKRAVSNMSETNRAALRTANSYASAFNKVFTKTFAGFTTHQNKLGTNKLLPELAILNLDPTKVSDFYKIRQIDDAMEFLVRNNYPSLIDKKVVQDNLRTYRGNRDLWLRHLLKTKVIKPVMRKNRAGENTEDFVLDQKALQKMIGTEEQPTLLGDVLRNNTEFKDLLNDLTEAQTRSTLYKNLNNKASFVNKQLSDVVTFRNFIGGNNVLENPNIIIGKMIGDPGTNKIAPNAVRNLKNVAKMVTSPNAPKGAKEGYVTALLDYAIKKNTTVLSDGSTSVNFAKLYNFLYSPLSRTSKSIMEILSGEDLKFKDASGNVTRFITNETVDNFKDILNIGKVLQQAAGKSDDLLEEALAKNTDLNFWGRVLARFSGSTIAKKVNTAAGGPGTLQVPQIGAEIGIRQWEKALPTTYTKNILIEAVNNPQLMAKIITMSKMGEKATGKNLLKLLNLLGVSIADELQPQAPYEPPSEDLEPVPQNVTQAPRVPQQVAMASPPPPAPKPDMASRARFQQLFPMDLASQTMTQTAPPIKSGIGSLA